METKNGFDKNKLDEEYPEINLVSKVSYNNGVDVKVKRVDGTNPFEAGLVTVALGGSYLGSCFVQEEPFYTAQNVAVMKSKYEEMTQYVNIFISGLVRFECRTKYYAFERELNFVISDKPEDDIIHMSDKSIVAYNSLQLSMAQMYVFGSETAISFIKNINDLLKSMAKYSNRES